MKKFVFIYNGPQSTSAPDPKVMEAWTSWFSNIGAKLVDPGNPFGPMAKEVDGSGVKDMTQNLAMGYSIVNAESLEEAAEIAKGCPNNGYDGYTVAVYEAMPM